MRETKIKGTKYRYDKDTGRMVEIVKEVPSVEETEAFLRYVSRFVPDPIDPNLEPPSQNCGPWMRIEPNPTDGTRKD
jgi:hypothetical protein